MSQTDTTSVTNEETTPAAPEATSPQLAEVTEAVKPEVSAEMTALQKQAKDYMDGWQRERADFANYKKRTEAQMKDIQQNAATQVLVGLLPIIDDFERALAHVPADLETHPWAGGVVGIHRKFQKLIEEQGITVIDPVGQPFDPTKHEAVMMENSTEVESGHVTATLQKGYLRGDRVLRPALVRVAN